MSYILLLGVIVITIILIITYKKTKRTCRRQKKTPLLRKFIHIFFIVSFVMFCICIFLPVIVLKVKPTSKLMQQETLQSYSNEYYKALDKILFISEVINDEVTIWEKMLLENLHFSKYNDWKTGVYSDEELRKCYIIDICEKGNSPSADFGAIENIITEFYGTKLLPTTEREINKISDDIPSEDKRYMTPPALFVEEFLCRIIDCVDTGNWSYSNIYQCARAADDALRRYLDSGSATTKIKILFASMAVALYQLSLNNLETELSNYNAEYQNTGMLSNQSMDRISFIINRYSFTEYKIAEIYIRLFNNSNNDLYEYNLHFLLSGEAHLLNAQKVFESYKIKDFSVCNVIISSDEDIHTLQTYHMYYIAYIQYKLIKLYNYNSDDIISDCIKNASRYSESPYAKEDRIEDCNYIIRNLQ